MSRAHSHNGNTTRIRSEDWFEDFATIRRATLDRALLETDELEADTVKAIQYSDWEIVLVIPGTNGRLWVGVEFEPSEVDPVPPPEGGWK